RQGGGPAAGEIGGDQVVADQGRGEGGGGPPGVRGDGGLAEDRAGVLVDEGGHPGRGDLRVVQGGDERDGRARGHGRAGGPVHRQARDGRGDRGEGDPADALGGVVTAPDGGLAVGERGQDGRGDGDVRRALPGDGRQAGAVGVGVGVGERRV